MKWSNVEFCMYYDVLGVWQLIQWKFCKLPGKAYVRFMMDQSSAYISITSLSGQGYIDWLGQERRTSIADALELRLPCTNPLIWTPDRQRRYTRPQCFSYSHEYSCSFSKKNLLERLGESVGFNERTEHKNLDTGKFRLSSHPGKHLIWCLLTFWPFEQVADATGRICTKIVPFGSHRLWLWKLWIPLYPSSPLY